MKRLAFMALFACFSFSFAKEDVESLKRQLEEQKRELLQKIEELEKKIKALEGSQSAQKPTAEEVKPESKEITDRTKRLSLKFDERRQTLGLFKGPSFLPDISLIVDTSVVSRNLKDEKYKLREIPAFFHAHEDEHGHGLNKNRGFNLNYAELFFRAPVDPYFDLNATITFTEEDTNLEEAYFVTRSLPFGFQVKGGKFRSSFGRHNQKHPHAWDFATTPLIYEAMLGEEGLVEKGLQINWLAPTPFYLLFGAEVFQGENEKSFGYKGFKILNKEVGDAPVPNLYTAFVKTSFDIGNLSMLTGFSYAQGKSRVGHGDHGFAGKTKLYNVELTGKYFFGSNRYLSLEGEYLYRDQKGVEYEDDNGRLRETGLNKKQSGFYLQSVLKFHKNWRVGVRYDLIDKNEVNGRKRTKDLPAYYAMLEYSPTEFSFIRLQVGRNEAYYVDGQRKKVNEVILQLNFSIGSHGAHPF